MARKPGFSRLIRDTRIERGLSVTEVAERVGVCVACVYLWEGDRNLPRDANLNALCKVFEAANESDQRTVRGVTQRRDSRDLIYMTAVG